MKLKENDNVPSSEIFVLENGEPTKKNIKELLKSKKAVIFGLPGAYTSVCSAKHLPGYVNLYQQYKDKGIDHIICVSVNDPFVMNAWGKAQSLENVKLIPDGSGEFSRKLGMLVAKDNLGFGMRSWRYAAVIKNQLITHWFEEPGFSDNYGQDPYSVSAPQHVLENL